MSVGLASLYEDIRQKRLGSRKSGRDDQSHTTSDGTVFLDTDSNKAPVIHQRYRYIKDIARGTYSQVVLAEDVYSPVKRCVAIKITNAHYRYIGVQETCRLRSLNRKDPRGQAHVIRLLSTFTLFNSHFCLVLELFQASLLSLNSLQFPVAMSSDQIKPVVLQLLSSLGFLYRQHIIHADLKPENVLVGNGTESVFAGPTRVGLGGEAGLLLKVADFGNAMELSDASAYYDDFEVQSLYYRAPEVLLGLPFGAAIDMWSLGCIVVELLLGRPLFKADGRSQLLGQMLALLGPISRDVYRHGKYYNMYFSQDHKPMHPDVIRALNNSSVSAIGQPTSSRIGLSWLLHSQDPILLDFLSGLLNFDPKKRLTPQQALSHPFCNFSSVVVQPSPRPISYVPPVMFQQHPLPILAGGIPCHATPQVFVSPIVTVAQSYMVGRPASHWGMDSRWNLDESVEGHKRKRGAWGVDSCVSDYLSPAVLSYPVNSPSAQQGGKSRRRSQQGGISETLPHTCLSKWSEVRVPQLRVSQ
eukprot:CAMPEP_0184644548 /NCGR_PEP_ID=MMETSP0308-20130426/1256_1 /TAXON_ID=38269 /ORGANISM="Gloeochaete witrockiana, Strain SAG 46.84" /LENGTH=526 /DNA_ID=CAMNT_0027073147 /DNA_START=326 /DNA_END=1909 /DNA_ORIENTATION=+